MGVSYLVRQVELPAGPVEEGQGNEFKERGGEKQTPTANLHALKLCTHSKGLGFRRQGLGLRV